MTRTAEHYTQQAVEMLEAGFTSKAGQKRAFEVLNSAHEILTRSIRAIFLAKPQEERTEAESAVYWGMAELHNWKAKHTADTLAVYPQAASICAEIEALVDLRAAIKGAEIVKDKRGDGGELDLAIIALAPAPITGAAIAKISASLKTIFAPMDAKVLEAAKEWAVGRVAALKEFKASDEYAALRRDASQLYERLHAIAGGKTWYAVFNGTGADYVSEFMTKNCAATAYKRNASITAKLVKAGVSEVVSEQYTHTNDGFNGVFIVNTNAGTKRVSIDTIYAGGYNIQCLHLRVLVKVK